MLMARTRLEKRASTHYSGKLAMMRDINRGIFENRKLLLHCLSLGPTLTCQWGLADSPLSTSPTFAALDWQTVGSPLNKMGGAGTSEAIVEISGIRAFRYMATRPKSFSRSAESIREGRGMPVF